VDAAGPVAQLGVVHGRQGRGVGHQMGLVVASQVSAAGKDTKLGEGLHIGPFLGLVVARHGHVHAGAVAQPSKLDRVRHERLGSRPGGRVVRRIGSDQDHVSRHGRRPRFFGVVEELDAVNSPTVRIRYDNGLVLCEIGRRHVIPFLFGCHMRWRTVSQGLTRRSAPPEPTYWGNQDP